jgi:uncharacterized membrane protein YkvA (DUF1232 family)
MSKLTDKQVKEEFEKYSRNVTKEDVSGVIDKEELILKKITGPLKKFGDNVKILFSLIKDYKSGKYREIPWTTMTAAIAALIYVFSPIDIVPDFIPFAGLIDDALIVSYCLLSIKADLDEYKVWKESYDFEYHILPDDIEN